MERFNVESLIELPLSEFRNTLEDQESEFTNVGLDETERIDRCAQARRLADRLDHRVHVCMASWELLREYPDTSPEALGQADVQLEDLQIKLAELKSALQRMKNSLCRESAQELAATTVS